MAERKYYWLKLKEDFFQQLEIKKLRRVAGGDTYTIIFLKLQLLSLKTDGLLEFIGLEDDFAEELALQIDEDIESVKFVLMYLKKIGWLVEEKDGVFSLPETIKNIGSETAAARRMRDKRNSSVTLLRPSVTLLQKCSTDIEIEIDKESEIDKERKLTNDKPKSENLKIFGEFHHVKLTNEQFKKLVNDYGSTIVLDYIKRLDEYIENTGKRYKNHNLTLRNWISKEHKRNNINYDIDVNQLINEVKKNDRGNF